MRRKVWLLVSAALVALALASCGSSNTSSTSTSLVSIVDVGCRHLQPYDCQDPVQTHYRGISCSQGAYVIPSTKVSLYGGDGNQAGTFELVRSRRCHDAIWPRVEGLSSNISVTMALYRPVSHGHDNQSYYQGSAQGTGVVYGNMLNGHHCLEGEAAVADGPAAKTSSCMHHT